MSSHIEKDFLRCYNPVTMESLKNIPISTADEIQMVLDQAKQSSVNFNKTTLNQRKKLVSAYRKAIACRTDELVELIRTETGKSHQDAMMEVFVGIDLISTLSSQAMKALAREKRSPSWYLHKRGWVEYHPHGVAGIISPWNYPFILTLSPVIEALLAGNTVVLKPSEQTPMTGLLLKEVFNEIADDPFVFQTIIGCAAAGKTLIESDDTDIICFTGSTAVGKVIAAACGERLKPFVLELGGKDAMIVLDDADLERAANACVWGGFSNAGQTCISVERVFVSESVFDSFTQLIKEKMVTVTCGENDDNNIGAMTMSSGLEKVKLQIEKAESCSEEIFRVKSSENNKGQFCTPTVVIEPDEDSEISNEESFGPVITVFKIKDEKDAIKRANECRYGLAASVFTSNKKRGRKVAGALEAGMVTINDIQTGYGMGSLPFGGVKDSGMGRVHGVEGLRTFSRVTSVVENRLNLRTEPWWYSGLKSLPRWVRKFIHLWYE